MTHRLNAHLVTVARVMLLTLGLVALSSVWGCAIGAVVGKAIPEYQKAAYTGLAGQTVGVMAWADRGVRIDWPSIRLDVAQSVQQRINRKTDAPELKGTTWPVAPASIVRYQQDHPATESMPVTDIAPKLGVTRLIYIELTQFRTRSAASLQMFRGTATYTLRVIEISGSKAHVAYEDSDILATFPDRAKSPPDGVLNSTDVDMYQGTILEMADQVAKRLTTHLAN